MLDNSQSRYCLFSLMCDV